MTAQTNTGLVILTGAGISAESGLGTFRDKDGIWTKYPLEDLASPQGFARDPVFVHGFYNERRQQLKSAKANAAHVALAKLEDALDVAGVPYMLVTQNVDNLHEQAGSRACLHMHGELTKIRCDACSRVMHWPDDIGVESTCAMCEHKGTMRPHVVWFGEMPLYMDEIYSALSSASTFVSIGTSGNVYPAAGFVQEASLSGAHTIELNLEKSEGAHLFDEGHYGLASTVVPQWVDRYIAEMVKA